MYGTGLAPEKAPVRPSHLRKICEAHLSRHCRIRADGLFKHSKLKRGGHSVVLLALVRRLPSPVGRIAEGFFWCPQSTGLSLFQSTAWN